MCVLKEVGLPLLKCVCVHPQAHIHTGTATHPMLGKSHSNPSLVEMDSCSSRWEFESPGQQETSFDCFIEPWSTQLTNPGAWNVLLSLLSPPSPLYGHLPKKTISCCTQHSAHWRCPTGTVQGDVDFPGEAFKPPGSWLQGCSLPLVVYPGPFS